MVTIDISTKKVSAIPADCLAVFLESGFSFSKHISADIKALFPALDDLIKQERFTGDAGSSLVVPVSVGNKISYLVLLGLGKKSSSRPIDVEVYRRALGSLVRTAERHKCASIALELPVASLFGLTVQDLGQQTASMLNIAAYHFDEFITDEARKITQELDITVCVDVKSKKAVDKGLCDGEIIADAVNMARHWIDLPPERLTPPQLADEARRIAKEFDLKYTVFNEEEINQMGMGGLAGVSRGSDKDCQLVILEYNCGKKTAPTLGFVGKGITFDSGGLSLKPAVYMETMKEDMSGAAAVISAMQAIAEMQPNVNVIGIAPLAENLPSGTATKPGDIVTFYNGKTAEVKNTDAEGRLILADALSYAVDTYKLDALVDLATLTGACAHALGPFFSGLMSKDEQLMSRIEKSAKTSGDAVWRLPFTDDYKKAIISDVADICNIGSQKYRAGAITAGFFLANFVGDVSWAHIDIAGTAYAVPDRSYYRSGATGVGVRLLVDLAMNWKK